VQAEADGLEGRKELAPAPMVAMTRAKAAIAHSMKTRDLVKQLAAEPHVNRKVGYYRNAPQDFSDPRTSGRVDAAL
jgi:hypothetical protein